MHAWLTGNLGDVWHMSALIERLRRLDPSLLTLSGFPEPHPSCDPVVASVDNVVLENPRLPKRAELRPAMCLEHVRDRRLLFENYDAVISVPGPFLQSSARRLDKAALDVRSARDVGAKFIVACHSMGPFNGDDDLFLRHADLIVSREPCTRRYLQGRGISSVDGADLAFSFDPSPLDADLAVADLPTRFGLVFLRSNNLDLSRIRRRQSTLFFDEEPLWTSTAPDMVLATSDRLRDMKSLQPLADRLEMQLVACDSLANLSVLTSAANDVLSDRYHPAIAALKASTPVHILSIDDRHKMDGLRELARDLTLEQIHERSEAALQAIEHCLQS